MRIPSSGSGVTGMGLSGVVSADFMSQGKLVSSVALEQGGEVKPF